MILLVNLAKIRKSKLANHLVVFDLTKVVPVLELLQYINFTLISKKFEKSSNLAMYLSTPIYDPNLFFSLLMIVVVVMLVIHKNIFIFINWISI